MNNIYKYSLLAVVFVLTLASCEKKEWQNNPIEKVPVYAISDIELTTPDVHETESSVESIDIYENQAIHISKTASFLTQQKLEAIAVQIAEGVTLIDYTAIGEFYFVSIDEETGFPEADTIVNPHYSYMIMNNKGTLDVSKMDGETKEVIRSYALKAKVSEKYFPL